jgi:hypothetical protein
VSIVGAPTLAAKRKIFAGKGKESFYPVVAIGHRAFDPLPGALAGGVLASIKSE